MILPLSFDSELFGYKVGKISLPDKGFFPEPYMETSKAYDLIYVFASSDDLLESVGDPISNRVEWEKDLSEENDPMDLPPSVADWAISLVKLGNKVKEGDRAALERLVLTCGTYSRFNIDPLFTNQEYRKLYLTWWGNLLAGKHTVLLAKRAREILGLITLRLDKKKAHVDLFAIMPETQGKGLGKLLLQKAMQLAGEKGMETITLSTQSDNKNAMKLYRNLGFQIQRETMIYHWRPNNSTQVPNAD